MTIFSRVKVMMLVFPSSGSPSSSLTCVCGVPRISVAHSDKVLPAVLLPSTDKMRHPGIFPALAAGPPGRTLFVIGGPPPGAARISIPTPPISWLCVVVMNAKNPMMNAVFACTRFDRCDGRLLCGRATKLKLPYRDTVEERSCMSTVRNLAAKLFCSTITAIGSHIKSGEFKIQSFCFVRFVTGLWAMRTAYTEQSCSSGWHNDAPREPRPVKGGLTRLGIEQGLGRPAQESR